jgi:hypothetical protein
VHATAKLGSGIDDPVRGNLAGDCLFLANFSRYRLDFYCHWVGQTVRGFPSSPGATSRDQARHGLIQGSQKKMKLSETTLEINNLQKTAIGNQ